MTLTNTFLDNIGKVLNGEAYTVPSYLTVGTDTLSIVSSMTEVSGEIGPREALSSTRDGEEVTWTAIRSGADVLDTTTGDDLNTIATLSAETGGELHTIVSLPGILHTTTFDIEVTWTVKPQ